MSEAEEKVIQTMKASDKAPLPGLDGHSCPECGGVVHEAVGKPPLAALGFMYYACESCPYFHKVSLNTSGSVVKDSAA